MRDITNLVMYLDDTHEFEEKYCPGMVYYVFAFKNPEKFVKDVLEFSRTHIDNERFQINAKRFLSSIEVPDKKYEQSRIPNPVQHDKCGNSANEPVHKSVSTTKTETRKHTVKYDSVKRSYSDQELKESIRKKLFPSVKSHKRYGRLSEEEKQFILINTSFTKREQAVFKLKCREKPYRAIALKLFISKSTVKQTAVLIDSQIRELIDKTTDAK